MHDTVIGDIAVDMGVKEPGYLGVGGERERGEGVTTVLVGNTIINTTIVVWLCANGNTVTTGREQQQRLMATQKQ